MGHVIHWVLSQCWFSCCCCSWSRVMQYVQWWDAVSLLTIDLVWLLIQASGSNSIVQFACPLFVRLHLMLSLLWPPTQQLAAGLHRKSHLLPNLFRCAPVKAAWDSSYRAPKAHKVLVFVGLQKIRTMLGHLTTQSDSFSYGRPPILCSTECRPEQ